MFHCITLLLSQITNRTDNQTKLHSLSNSSTTRPLENSLTLSPTHRPNVLPVNHNNNNVSHYFQPQRQNILLPKLESSGRPSCVQSPDDTFCEVTEHYPE